MTAKKRNRILISGGGTGGHIFPAIAIANALKNRDANMEILFVGAKGRMEMEKVPIAGYEIIGLPISGFQRSLSLKNLTFPFKLITSLLKAKKILRKFNPDVVIGVGGYASGPTLRAANKMNISTLIQEQNSLPGITNRVLAKKADKICVAYDGTEKYFPLEKIVKTGNPIRRQVVQIGNSRNDGIQFFRLEEDLKTLFVVGGSLGAWAINESIEKDLAIYRDSGIQIIWQTGKPFYSRAVEAVKKGKFHHVRVVDFISRMEFAYAAADIIVSRAGAIAIAELCSIAKPSIFVPLPTAAEDHQKMNALALVEKDAALMIENSKVKDELSKNVIALAHHPAKCNELSENLKKLAILDADERIADEVFKLINK